MLDEARPHAMAAVVYQLLAPQAERLPAAMVTAMRDEALGVTAGTMRVSLQLLAALRALGAVGIVPVVLKGPALADRYWEPAASRPTTDVDLLVQESELERADRGLRSIGLVPPSDALAREARSRHHHLAYRGASASVELHFRLNSGLGSDLRQELLVPRLRDGTFRGHVVRYLGTEDELIFLAVHAAGHLFARLSWLWDVKQFLLAERVDWQELIATAIRAKVTTAVWLALSLAQESLGARVPAPVLTTLRPAPMRVAVLSRLFPATSVVHSGLTGAPVRAAATRLLMADSPTRATKLLLRGTSRHLRRRLGATFPSWTPDHWSELF